MDLDNIREGVELLDKILKLPEPRILLIIDCDADGYCSSTIIYQYIKKICPKVNIEYKIHNKKQHGLEDHIASIESEKENYDLIIIPDAGSNDKQYTDRINCPFLILDHHLVDEEIGKNVVLINNQSSDRYLNKGLSGGGVVWQFCRAFDDIKGFNYSSNYIDLAAMSIISDMMSLKEIENQAIIHEGLKKINNFFFSSLIDKQSFSMNGKVNPTTIAFYIVPLINAMVRMGTMDEKKRMFEAFLDGTRMVPSNKRGAKGEMELLAIESARECTNTKSRQDKEKEKITEQLEQKIFKYDLLENEVLFIRLDDDDIFPSELNGLVATQLSAKYHKPTIIARLNSDGYDRGSIRAPGNTELTSFKDYLMGTGLFEYVLGHDMAAGCSIEDSKISLFHKKANEDFKDIDFGQNIYEVDFVRHAVEPDLSELIFTIGNYDWLWGQELSEPLLYIDDINLESSEIQVCGSRQDTVRFEKFGVTYIQFHAKQLIEDLKRYPTIKINLVGRANINEWMGNKKPQIFIKDYEIFNGELSF